MAHERVQPGGMFDSTRPQISHETQALLKVMMEESKLTNFQQRTLSSSARGGKPLPVSCNPTSSRSKQRSPVKPVSPPKAMNARHLSSGIRKKETIDFIVENNQELPYRPMPSKLITEKDKRKLQNKMAYGIDVPEVTKVKPKAPTIEPETQTLDEFDQVLQDIEERKEFLDEMESLGQGTKYRTIIKTEISQKIRDLEIIDKIRSKELEEHLKQMNTSDEADK